jgi:hypothetical protein
MTQKSDRTLIPEILEKIAGQGLDVLPELIRIVLNIAMQAERQAYLGVQPYERSPHRREHANGCKPKTMATRMGEITFDVPQIRKGDFYPSALERDIRNERALTLALVETYVQGVSVACHESWDIGRRCLVPGSSPSNRWRTRAGIARAYANARGVCQAPFAYHGCVVPICTAQTR